jgi:hypothetical protein
MYKKSSKILLYFCCYFVFVSNIIAQNNNGYENLQWGDSFEKVKSLYTNIKEVLRKDLTYKDFDYDYLPSQDQEIIGVKLFKQLLTQSDVQVRYFYFYKNELYNVFVVYRSRNIEDNLLAQLIKKYGYTDTPNNKRSYNEILDWWRKYNRISWEFSDTRIVALHYNIIETEFRDIKIPTRVNYFSLSRYRNIDEDISKYKINSMSGKVDL